MQPFVCGTQITPVTFDPTFKVRPANRNKIPSTDYNIEWISFLLHHPVHMHIMPLRGWRVTSHIQTKTSHVHKQAHRKVHRAINTCRHSTRINDQTYATLMWHRVPTKQITVRNDHRTITTNQIKSNKCT